MEDLAQVIELNGVTDGARTRDNQNHNLSQTAEENSSLADSFGILSARRARKNQSLAASARTIFGTLLLALTPILAQAQDLRHTFVFSTPFIDEHGDKDKTNDTRYPELVIEAPAAPDELFDIRGVLGPCPLSGSCLRSEAKRYNCQLMGPFVTFSILLYLDGRDTWGEIQAISGMFGSAYNLLGLLKSEPAK